MTISKLKFDLLVPSSIIFSSFHIITFDTFWIKNMTHKVLVGLTIKAASFILIECDWVLTAATIISHDQF